MEYEAEDLRARIYNIFNPEPDVDNEGFCYRETRPHERLIKEYRLDTSYWEPYEYSSSSDLMRRAKNNDDGIGEIIRAQQVPRELFLGTLRLFGDSIVAYADEQKRTGPYQYYPAILMSAWAAFEAFVRIYSELLVKTVPALPIQVKWALLEKEDRLDGKGKFRALRKMQPLLDRYWWLLRFGYGVDYDRGGTVWQMGEKALQKRNELVHYEIAGMPSLTTTGLWQHLESILLLLIGPSAQIRKTVMPDQYELYGVLNQLRPLVEEFEERPFFKGLPIKPTAVIFPCPFRDVDDARYPRS